MLGSQGIVTKPCNEPKRREPAPRPVPDPPEPDSWRSGSAPLDGVVGAPLLPGREVANRWRGPRWACGLPPPPQPFEKPQAGKKNKEWF